jgi:predicted transposase YdaD
VQDDGAKQHDRLFRYTFERPAVTEGELRSVLPAPVVEALDFTSLTLEPGTLVDAEHAELETDLLYRVQLSGEEGFIFILFEHQSSADGMMPYRMARYMLRIWERWSRAQATPAKRLPVIVPLLLSNDQRPWRAARSLRELYAAPSGVLDALGPHLLDVTLRIDDLSAQSSEAFKARASLNALGRLTLLMLQPARVAGDLVNELTDWWDLVTDLARSRQGNEDLVLLFRYAHQVADFDPGRLRTLARGLGKTVEESVMTAAERLRAEGHEKGKAEGQTQLLLRLLTLRFGLLEPATEQRIRSARTEELELMAERILSATNIADVLG